MTVAARTWALPSVTPMVSVVSLGAALVRRARRRIVPPGRDGTVVELAEGLAVTTVSVPGHVSADSFHWLLHASILKAPELDAVTVNVADVMTSVPVFTTVKNSAGSFSPLPLPVAPPFAYVKTSGAKVYGGETFVAATAPQLALLTVLTGDAA